MFQKFKSTLQTSFYQILVVYSLLILAIAFGLFSKYSLQFHIFAIILGVFGIFVLNNADIETKQSKINKKLFYLLFAVAIILIFILRIIPYLHNSIPLGYDTGIYKYGIEFGLQNLDKWILTGGMEPGFLYLMSFFKFFFSSQFILTYLLIAFCVFLGFGVYFVVKEFSNKTTGLIALFLYAFSIIQYKAFWYMYYKNIIAMALILFSIYFLKKYENTNKNIYLWYFTLSGALIGWIHRPSFYIFGISYFLYCFISPIKNKKYNFSILKKNVFFGFLIVLFANLLYLGKFKQAIWSAIPWVAEGFLAPGESPGTFISFFTYQFSSLFYLPFAFLGLFYFIKKKNINFLVIWAIINLSIVYFQFFFFNRFIIFLDLVLIIMASFGFSLLIENKKKSGILILVLLLFSAGIFAYNEAKNSKPLISENELNVISYLTTIEQDAYAMATSSIYSPWVQGYSNRKTIAPGLFDYDTHNKTEWLNFWKTTDISEIKLFMEDYNQYNQPIYIFIGQKQKDNLKQFSQCFSVYYESGNNKIYKYIC